jgi:amidohydrolase
MGLYRLFVATVEHDAVTDEPVAPLITFRRDLHAHPELRFTETRTAQRIAAAVAPFADTVITGIGGTGVLARVDGEEPGDLVLIRADIDAYPVADAKDVSYRSVTPGVAHACGHDVHATVAVGVLQHFGVHRPRRGSVAAIFQPAEEIPFGATSGASVVLADEAMAKMRPRAVLGVHCWPQLAAGAIGVESRLAMAAKDAFEITVHGTSAHVATPANGRDAILAASVLVTNLHAAVARRRDPHEQVALNVGTFNGGTSQSALASEVVVTGTLRTHDEGVRQVLRSVIASVTEGVGVQFDTPLTLRWANEMPAVINEPGLVQLARTTLPAVAEVVDLDVGPMTSDDFALYASLAPTLYLKLGVARPGGPVAAPLHSSTFDVDERCIDFGVTALAALALALLDESEGASPQ